jgi:hypothetical protein
MAGYSPWRNGAGALLGLGLLLAAGYRLVCGNQPRLLPIGPDTALYYLGRADADLTE